jgi:four helix bundle protein
MLQVDAGENKREYDLEERTYQFARRVRLLFKKVPKTISNIDDGKQVIRASGSVGANYIEANESLGEKDFLLHIKISRKEAKESRYWLRLLDLEAKPDLEPERSALLQEAEELMRIFGAIVRKRS